VIKALIDAGATTNISDDNGRLPHTRAKKQCTDEANKQTSMEILMSAMKEEYERSKDTYVYPPVRRAGELCQMGDEHFNDEEWELAAEMYRKSINCSNETRLTSCGIKWCKTPTAHITHAKLATCKLNDAMERIVNGNSGFRACFKEAYEAALKCTELEPNYEDGWKALARGYIGFRELPRAKQAAATGYQHFPASKLLHEIWSTLHVAGVPDTVVDHDSQEYKDIYRRIYYERWIGPIQCTYCELKCMDDPCPSKCPFCGCPTDKDLEDIFEDTLPYFLFKETPYEEMCAEEEEENVENDSESDDEGMPPLLDEKKESGFTFQAPTPDNGNSGAPSFSFGSPSTGSSSQPSTFVFGSPDHKQDSSKEDDDEEEDGDKNESKRDDEKPLYID
jgi:hypothetical protein